jgi:lysophospholipase L1-like esterase
MVSAGHSVARPLPKITRGRRKSKVQWVSIAPYQSGDNLHPSDAGYQVMANAVGVKNTVAATR